MPDVPLEETRTGEMLGRRYLVGALIGRGAHGEVYRASDIIDRRDVAVKFLAPHIANDDDYRQRLVREARATSVLEGKGTLEIMGVMGAEDGTPCLVMELLEGEDLSTAIDRRSSGGGRFSTEEVVTLFTPVAKTLEAAHSHDIVHRDIKPSNIYLVGNSLNDPRIMDFGLAKWGGMAAITADQMLAGSPSYIAPEIWKKGARDADRRADIYSLAVVIFQTLTGDVPIYRKNLAEMLIAVTTPGNLPSLHRLRPDLSTDIDTWLAQAMAIDPAARFQTVNAMWRAFRFTVGI